MRMALLIADLRQRRVVVQVSARHRRRRRSVRLRQREPDDRERAPDRAAPIAEWLSAANRLAIASPLGWAPAPDGSGIAPTFPRPAVVMALFTLVGGPNAMFFVAPVMGLVTLWLVYRLARAWLDAESALVRDGAGGVESGVHRRTRSSR